MEIWKLWACVLYVLLSVCLLACCCFLLRLPMLLLLQLLLFYVTYYTIDYFISLSSLANPINSWLERSKLLYSIYTFMWSCRGAMCVCVCARASVNIMYISICRMTLTDVLTRAQNTENEKHTRTLTDRERTIETSLLIPRLLLIQPRNLGNFFRSVFRASIAVYFPNSQVQGDFRQRTASIIFIYTVDDRPTEKFSHNFFIR